MARNLKGYVRAGLLISEGLVFSLEDGITNVDYFRNALDEAFRHNSPGEWTCRPIFPDSENDGLRGLEYETDLLDGRKVKIATELLDGRKRKFVLRVIDGQREQLIDRDSAGVGEFLGRLFLHVHKYSNHSY